MNCSFCLLYTSKDEADIKTSIEMEADMDGDMENTQKDKFTYNLDLSGLVLNPKTETNPDDESIPE